MLFVRGILVFFKAFFHEFFYFFGDDLFLALHYRTFFPGYDLPVTVTLDGVSGDTESLGYRSDR